MRKIISSLVLVTMLIVNNFTFVGVYADSSLFSEKNSTMTALDKMEDKVIDTLDIFETKIKDEDLKDKIEEKQKEIQKLVEETKKDIKNEDSKSDIREILEETAKTITLKAVPGVTPTTDVTENITKQIEIPKNEIKQAENTLLDSIESEDGYVLMLKTAKNLETIKNLLKKYDENLSINFLFEEGGINYFELKISNDSLIRKELLEDVETGEVPSNLLGIEVIKPELLKIGEEKQDNNSISKMEGLSGESIDKLWGIKKYGLEKYEEAIKNQTNNLGRKIEVGVIDTGISFNHPDLKNKVSATIPGYDFVNDDNDPSDDQGHGTHVSGTIAGDINGSGVFGVNPFVEIVPLKICDNKGFCPTYGVLKALEYAKDKRLDVLNMSLGARGNVATSPVCKAIKDITENGSIVVAASGNSNIDTSLFVPGGCSESITVGAVDENMTRAAFSNYGDKVDVSAPGVGIYSSYLNNNYKNLNGTSMSTPHIVGLVSIIKTFKPGIKSQEVKQILKTNSVSVNTESNKKIAGFVDVEKMMASLGIVFSEKQEKPTEEVISDSEKTDKIVDTQENKEDLSSYNVDSNIVFDENQQNLDTSISKSNQEKLDNAIQMTEQQENDSANIKIDFLDQSDKIEINSTDSEKGEKIGEESIDDSTITYQSTQIDVEQENPNLSETPVLDENTSSGQVDESDVEDSEDEDSVKINASDDYYFTINQTDKIVAPNYMSKYAYYSENPRIADLTNVLFDSKWKMSIVGYSVGSTKIYGYYRGTLRMVYYVTVNKIPDPKEMYCNVITGEDCYVSMRNKGVSAEESRSGILKIKQYNNAVRVSTLGSGIGKVYIKSDIGDYYSTKLIVNISSKPPQILDCTVPQGLSCISGETKEENGYSFATTNKGIVSVTRTSYKLGQQTYYQYNIKGEKEGETEVYIYRNNDHISTLKTKILPKVNPIKFSLQDIKIKQGEQKTINILDGGGDYKIDSHNGSISVLNINNTNKTISFEGLLPGDTTSIIRDKYNQQQKIRITVLDTILELSTYQIEVKVGGDLGFININDYYKGLNPIKQTNANVKATIYDYQENGKAKKQLRIEGKTAGETILELQDLEGNKRTVKVVSKGSAVQIPLPSEEDKIIQEIDDLLNSILGQGGVKINSDEEEDGVEVNSV